MNHSEYMLHRDPNHEFHAVGVELTDRGDKSALMVLDVPSHTARSYGRRVYEVVSRSLAGLCEFIGRRSTACQDQKQRISNHGSPFGVNRTLSPSRPLRAGRSEAAVGPLLPSKGLASESLYRRKAVNLALEPGTSLNGSESSTFWKLSTPFQNDGAGLDSAIPRPDASTRVASFLSASLHGDDDIFFAPNRY